MFGCVCAIHAFVCLVVYVLSELCPGFFLASAILPLMRMFFVHWLGISHESAVGHPLNYVTM